ncbi:SMI1/KNR4 family protein [Streptomyces virginiae]|uniref:SMI1/KNR4 family protein n=1 Tax=Streptomyces virginiae TaxID=1961 RepID=A0ABZ1TRA6_STRVG
MTPPAAPVEARGDWTAAETALGVRLPDDYKWLVATYGWGEFGDFLYLHTPFGANRYNRVEWQGAHPTESPERDRERYPYPLHPAPGGLLIWGTTMNADRLCRLTDGDPEEWPVVVWSSEGWYETHRTGAAAFVEGWVGGRVHSRLLGAMDPDLAPWFNTFRPRVDRCLVLSEGPLPHDERLRRLRTALAPTTDRTAARGARSATGADRTTSRPSTPTGCSPTTPPTLTGSGSPSRPRTPSTSATGSSPPPSSWNAGCWRSRPRRGPRWRPGTRSRTRTSSSASVGSERSRRRDRMRRGRGRRRATAQVGGGVGVARLTGKSNIHSDGLSTAETLVEAHCQWQALASVT